MNAGIKPITIFGLGYVGLPLSLSYSAKGYKIYGIDISVALVNELKSGLTYLVENHMGKSIRQILIENLQSDNFIPSVTADEALDKSDKFIVTVGIPVKDGKLDYEPLRSVCSTISRGLKKGDTVVIRSTLVPGTTMEMVIPILEKSDLCAGKDFHLVYCPERISEGNAFDEIENVPVLISGISTESIEMGKKIIGMISKAETVPVSSVKLAETAKLAENIQRDVNIAIAHQFAEFCRNTGMNVFELIRAINTHPRVNILKPGPGVGGHCIPNALHYLSPVAIKTGTDIALFGLSRKINDDVPCMIADRIKKYLIGKQKQLALSKVAILGAAMKDYCGDIRQSPALRIIDELSNSGIAVSVYDPYVYTAFPFKEDNLKQCLNNADCLLITAIQAGIGYNDFTLFKSLMHEESAIFDTKNVIDGTKAEENGFHVMSI